MKDYVQIYSDEVKRFRALNPKNGQNLQRHHVWPVSLGGENKDENYVYVTEKQHRRLHTIFNLALIQSGNLSMVGTLDYSQMLPLKEELDLSIFRNSRIAMERSGIRVSMSLAKATDLCRMIMMHPLPCAEMTWRVLTSAMFGKKYMGFKMSLKLHRRKDDAAICRLKAAMGENMQAISA